MIAESSKSGIKVDEYLKSEITQMYMECLKNPILNEIMKEKISHVRWIVFRPLKQYPILDINTYHH